MVVAADGIVNNTVVFSGDKIVEQTVETQELTARQFSFVGGEAVPNRGEIHLVKKR